MSSYWEKRAEERMAQLERDVDVLTEEMIDDFKEALKDVQASINSFWMKYATNNQLTYSQAQQLLNLKEMKKFKGTLEEFMQKAKDSIGTFDLEVTNLSHKVRISRLQSLEAEIKGTLANLYRNQEERITSSAQNIYLDQYFSTMFDVDHVSGVHHVINFPNAQSIEEIARYPFNGLNYSERIWKQQSDLAIKLKQTITNMMIQGKNPYDCQNEILKYFDVKKREAYRLLNTEHAYVAGQATKQAYLDDGIEKYKISATLDLSTSQICRDMDGKVFKTEDARVGENYNPFHPHCRTSTVPYIEELEDLATTRVARDPVTGERVTVPKDMTYSQWHDKYVKGNAAAELNEKHIQKASSDKAQYDKYLGILGKENMPETFVSFQKMKYNDSNEWEVKQREWATINKIKNKESYSDQYREKMINGYYDFRKEGYEFTDHSLNRFFGQKKSKGKTEFTKEKMFGTLNKPANYLEHVEADNSYRMIKFYEGISTIQNQKTREVISIIARENIKESWVKYEE